MLADLFPTTISEGGVLVVMLVVTALVLLAVGIGVIYFALWSKRDKEKRARDVERSENLKG